MSTQKPTQFYSKLPTFGSNQEVLQQVNRKQNCGCSSIQGVCINELQAMARHVGNLIAYCSVKEASLKGWILFNSNYMTC